MLARWGKLHTRLRLPGLPTALIAAVVATVALAGAGPAAANGPCFDPSEASACPVSANGTLSGTLTSSTEHDWYVFYVTAQTDLTVTINDLEDPSCSKDYACGSAKATVTNSGGKVVAESELSYPREGVAVPYPVEAVIEPGLYYIEVTGNAGEPDTPPAVPYQLSVEGNPPVESPPCSVPHVSKTTKLGLAERILEKSRCTVGAIHRQRGRGVPPGDVIRLKPGAGSTLPNGAPVAIYVAGKATPRRHHHAAHHRGRHRHGRHGRRR